MTVEKTWTPQTLSEDDQLRRNVSVGAVRERTTDPLGFPQHQQHLWGFTANGPITTKHLGSSPWLCRMKEKKNPAVIGVRGQAGPASRRPSGLQERLS